MLEKLRNLFGKKCLLCNRGLDKDYITAEVKVPNLVGLHKRYFCSNDHYSKYQDYIKKYEKKRKIPMSNCTVCTACMKK